MEEFFNNIGTWFENNWVAIVKVVLLLTVGFLLVNFFLAIVKRKLKKSKIEKTIQGFIVSILRFVLYLVLVCCIIASLGISITGLTVVVSAITLAISLALQDSLKNLVNGFVIISTKLVKEGDWIKIGDYEGSVTDVRMLYIVLTTADNKKITIPNTSVITSQIINYNVNKSRRLDLNFDIAYDSNVDLAKEILLNVANSNKDVFDDPKPQAMLVSLNNSSITVRLRVWCASEDYWNVNWFLLDNVFNEFKRNNITIPFNQLEVALVDPNKKNYVREQSLLQSETHKKQNKDDDDFITTFNKNFKNASQKEKAFRAKLKKNFEEKVKNLKEKKIIAKNKKVEKKQAKKEIKEIKKNTKEETK